MNKPVKLRYANQLVGAMVLLVTLLLAVAIVFVARRQEWGGSTYELKAYISDSVLDGLRKGTAVMVLGQQAGEIVSIDYSAIPNRPDVDLAITLRLKTEPFQSLIYAGSVAHIRHHLAGAGDAFLEIKRGELRQQVLKDGDEIVIVPEATATDRMDQLVEMMGEVRDAFVAVRENFIPALNDISTFSQHADQSNTQLQQVLSDFQQVSPRLNPLVDQTQDVLNELQQFAPQLSPLADRADRVLSDMQEVSPRLRPLVDRADDVLANSQAVVQNLRDETNELPGTVTQLRESVDTAQDVLDAMKRHWLLRRYIKQPHPDPTIPPAEVGRGAIWP